jgi:hypothetical protein
VKIINYSVMKSNTAIILFVFCSCFVLITFGQRKTKLNTNGKGTLYGGINFNRSYYTNSKLQLLGPQFDFNLLGTPMHDNPDFNGSLFHADGITYFQFSAQIGYFMKNKWALSLGFDRLNMFTPKNFDATINGVIAPNSSNLEGNYDNTIVAIQESDFYYRQSDGANLVGLSIHRMDQLYKSKKAQIEVLSYTKAGIGALFSTVDFTFNSITSQQNTSLSGLGLNTGIGIRTYFWQTIYLHTSVTGGVLNQRNIDLGQNRSLRHITPYFSPEIGIGFSYFIRPTDCNTCPQW